MSFKTYQIKNKNEKAIPALYKKNVNKNLTKRTYTLRVKRAFCRHSLRKSGMIRQNLRIYGSMSVEAALVFPLVLFVWVAFVSLTSVVRVHEAVQQSLADTAAQLAVEAGENEAVVRAGWMAKVWFGLQTLEDLESGGICSVSGYDFLGSEVLNDGEWLRFQVRYRVKLFSGFIPVPEIPLENQVYVRAWTGYVPGNYAGNPDGLQKNVYVTEYGRVYHEDRLCSHIHLKIYMVSESEAKQHPPCEKCAKDIGDTAGTFYVTESGDCYHSRLGCSGLKRSVERMSVEEAVSGGCVPCSRCGEGSE